MKIILDATPVRSYPSGIGIYIRHLLAGLIQVISDRFFTLGDSVKILYQDRAFKNQLSQQASGRSTRDLFKFLYYPIPSELTLQLCYHTCFFRQALECFLGRSDIFHGLNYLNYPLPRTLNVLTIHDLSFMRYPQYAPVRVLRTYEKRLRQCLNWTDLIITVSEHTKKDVIDLLKIDRQRIWVTPLASRYTSSLTPADPYSNLKSTPKNTLHFPYFLFVGTLEPRKNILTLIQAFEILKERDRIPHHLVMIGKKGWKYQAIVEAIETSPVRDHIHQLDYLADDQVAQFYQSATLFWYLSYYEGFGLPVLEAMTFGIPVITSNRSSLPEIAAGSAILIDPDDLEGLVEATRSLLGDRASYDRLSTEGQARSRMFSWQKTALKTLEAYHHLLG